MGRIAMLAATTLLLGCPADGASHCDEPLAQAMADGNAITFESLLVGMRDPLLPTQRQAQTVRLASSYDRGAEQGDWFANSDAGHFQAIEGDRAVLLRADGPGYVSRIWSANPQGSIEIYVDGELVISGDMPSVLNGSSLGLPSELAFIGGGGYNFYLPIPYERSIEIVSQVVPLYYHVTYTTLPIDSEVVAFDPAVLDSSVCAPPAPRGTSASSIEEAALASSGQEMRIEGEGVIRQLELELDNTEREVLRGTELSIRFDSVETVRVPLGDFFGGGPGLVPYRSQLAEVTGDGRFVARWAMPFRESAEISLRSINGTSTNATIRALVEEQSFEDSLYFHARWVPPTPIRVSDAAGERLYSDLRLVMIEGGGNYVGTVLNVADPSPSWWGEGDEKIFVDGEDFPSHFGTGTEDYFGWAWCSTERFTSDFVGQTRTDANNPAGYISAYRWHSLDAIPFASQLIFDMEVIHWHTDPNIDVTYDAVVYFYAEPDAVVTMEEASDDDYRIPDLPSDEINPGSEITTCG